MMRLSFATLVTGCLLWTTPVTAAFFDAFTGRSHISIGELQSAFDLSHIEAQNSLFAMRIHIREDVTYHFICEWSASDGTARSKYFESHLIYRSEVNSVAKIAGQGNVYTGLAISGGTGVIQFIREDPQPLIGSPCIAFLPLETSDPNELFATLYWSGGTDGIAAVRN